MTPQERRQLIATIIATGDMPLVLRMNAGNEEFDSVSRDAMRLQASGDFDGLTQAEIIAKLEEMDEDR